MSTPIACPPVKNDLLADLETRVGEQAWAGEAAALLQRVNQIHYAEAGDTPPAGETGWYHFYVCPETSQRLVFDPHRPHTHISPATGKTYTGSPYDECWRTMMNGAWIGALERAAILERAGLGSPEQRDWMRRTLRYWAETWQSHQPKPRAGIGRLMPQGLTEAIFQASICQVLQWLPDLMVGDDWLLLREAMLEPAAEFLRPQWAGGSSSEPAWGGDIHNIACWVNAAKFGLGWALDDDSLKDLAINGPVGWHAQVAKGIHADGWWYEKTLTYQTYSLRALLTMAMLARADGLNLIDEPKLALMAEAVLRVIRHDGSLPAWNDGWREHDLGTIVDALEILAGQSHEEIGGYLAWLLASFPGARSGSGWSAIPGSNTWLDESVPPRGGVAALAWGLDHLPPPTEPERNQVFFPDSGIAIIRRGAVLISMRSGPHGGGHDHRDRTDVSLRLHGHPIAEDMGTPSYGSPLTGTWYRQPASHRLLIINRQAQRPSDGQIVEAGARHIHALATEAWPEADLERVIEIDEDGLGWQDQTIATLTATAQIDWVFHLRGEPMATESWPEDETDLNGGGLEHITHLQQVPRLVPAENNEPWNLRWHTAAGVLGLALRVDGLEDPILRLGECPDNPANQQLSAVVLSGRSNADRVTVTARWQLLNA